MAVVPLTSKQIEELNQALKREAERAKLKLANVQKVAPAVETKPVEETVIVKEDEAPAESDVSLEEPQVQEAPRNFKKKRF